MSILFAATFPERVHSLTLFGTFASFARCDDHPWMPTDEERAARRQAVEEYWGSGLVLGSFCPAGEVTDDNLEDFAASEVAGAALRPGKEPGPDSDTLRRGVDERQRSRLKECGVPDYDAAVHCHGCVRRRVEISPTPLVEHLLARVISDPEVGEVTRDPPPQSFVTTGASALLQLVLVS